MVVNVLLALALLSVAGCDYCKDQKWNYYKAENKYIKLLPGRTDWTGGYQQCRKNHGDLLIMKNTGMANFLGTITTNQDAYYWTGLRTSPDRTSAEWLDGRIMEYTSKQPGCFLISLNKSSRNFGTLDMKDCKSRYMSICQSHDPCGPRPLMSIMNKRNYVDKAVFTINKDKFYTLICHMVGNKEEAAILYFSCKGRRKTSKDKVDLSIRYLGTAIDKIQCTCSLLRTDRSFLVKGVRFTSEDSFRDGKFKVNEVFVKNPGDYFETHLWRNGSLRLKGILTKDGKNVSNLVEVETRPDRFILKMAQVEQRHGGSYVYLIQYPNRATIEYGFIIVVITAPFQLAPGEDLVQNVKRPFGRGVALRINIFGRTNPRKTKLFRDGVQMSKKLYTCRFYEQMKTLGTISLHIPGAVEDGSYKLAIESHDGYSLEYRFRFHNLNVPFRIIRASSNTQKYNEIFGQGLKVAINITGTPDPKGYTLTRNDVTVATDTYSITHTKNHVAKTFQTGIVSLVIFDVVQDGNYVLGMKEITSGKKIQYNFQFYNKEVPLQLLTVFDEVQMFNSIDAISRGINISVSGSIDHEGFRLTRNGFEVRKNFFNLTYAEGIFPNGTITIHLSEISLNGFYKLSIKDNWGKSIHYDFYYNSMLGGQDSRHVSATGLLIRGVLAIFFIILISMGMFIIGINCKDMQSTLPLRTIIERGDLVQPKPDESSVACEEPVEPTHNDEEVTVPQDTLL